MDDLSTFPRMSLSNLGTPLEKCSRISALFPDGPEIYIKRDDFIGSLVWGNKLRKLEFVLADAIKKGADTIITCGGVQSNHARTTAQVCKRIGLDCILVQNGTEPKLASGNHKVNKLLDIPIHYVRSSEDRQAKMQEIAEGLEYYGKKPFIIPLGASDNIGCLGLALAIKELKQQESEIGIRFDYLIHASSSGGTQAGFELGKRLFGMDHMKIIGISADASVEDLSQSILGCTGPAIQKLDATFEIIKEDLNIDTSFVGPGYGIASKQSDEAKRMFVEHEGIMLDTTYTGKAAAGLIDYVRKGTFKSGEKVLFWHTGGILAEM